MAIDQIFTRASKLPTIQKFTASGTYTPTSGMLYCTIECLGGGGGGGGAAGTAGGIFSGCGGGSGVRAIKYFVTAATIGASQTVTIGAAGTAGSAGANAGGAGGNTSVGAICIANGGTGGGGGSTGTGPAGSSGATVGTGDIVAPGSCCLPGVYSNGVITPAQTGGAGGNSVYGAGGNPTLSLGSSTGAAGLGFGSGGGGGLAANTASTFAGGAGTAGLVIITEFFGT